MVKFAVDNSKNRGESSIRYLGETTSGGGGYSPQLDLAQYLALLATGKKVQADDLYGGLENAKANSLTYWGRSSFPDETTTEGDTPGATPDGTGRRVPVGGTDGNDGTGQPIRRRPPRTTTPPPERYPGDVPPIVLPPEVPPGGGPPGGGGGSGGGGGEGTRGGEGGPISEVPRGGGGGRNRDPGANMTTEPTPEELLRQWVRGQRG